MSFKIALKQRSKSWTDWRFNLSGKDWSSSSGALRASISIAAEDSRRRLGKINSKEDLHSKILFLNTEDLQRVSSIGKSSPRFLKFVVGQSKRAKQRQKLRDDAIDLQWMRELEVRLAEFQWRILCLAMVGLLLAIIVREMCQKEDFSSFGVNALKLITTTFTLIQCYLMWLQIDIKDELSRVRQSFLERDRGRQIDRENVESARQSLIQKCYKNLVQVLVWIPINLVHPLPWVSKSFQTRQLDLFPVYRLESFVAAIMLLRIIHVFIFFRLRLVIQYLNLDSSLIVHNERAVVLLNDPGLSQATLALKMALMRNPTFVISLAWCVLILSSAVVIRVSESTAGVDASPYMWDQLWLVIVTATTTGYGDINPQTHFGRFGCVVCMLSGPILVSLTTATLSRSMTLTRREELLMDTLDHDRLAADLQAAAATLLQMWWRDKRQALQWPPLKADRTAARLYQSVVVDLFESKRLLLRHSIMHAEGFSASESLNRDVGSRGGRGSHDYVSHATTYGSGRRGSGNEGKSAPGASSLSLIGRVQSVGSQVSGRSRRNSAAGDDASAHGYYAQSREAHGSACRRGWGDFTPAAESNATSHIERVQLEARAATRGMDAHKGESAAGRGTDAQSCGNEDTGVMMMERMSAMLEMLAQQVITQGNRVEELVFSTAGMRAHVEAVSAKVDAVSDKVDQLQLALALAHHTPRVSLEDLTAARAAGRVASDESCTENEGREGRKAGARAKKMEALKMETHSFGGISSFLQGVPSDIVVVAKEEARVGASSDQVPQATTASIIDEGGGGQGEHAGGFTSGGRGMAPEEARDLQPSVGDGVFGSCRHGDGCSMVGRGGKGGMRRVVAGLPALLALPSPPVTPRGQQAGAASTGMRDASGVEQHGVCASLESEVRQESRVGVGGKGVSQDKVGHREDSNPRDAAGDLLVSSQSVMHGHKCNNGRTGSGMTGSLDSHERDGGHERCWWSATGVPGLSAQRTQQIFNKHMFRPLTDRAATDAPTTPDMQGRLDTCEALVSRGVTLLPLHANRQLLPNLREPTPRNAVTLLSAASFVPRSHSSSRAASVTYSYYSSENTPRSPPPCSDEGTRGERADGRGAEVDGFRHRHVSLSPECAPNVGRGRTGQGDSRETTPRQVLSQLSQMCDET